jgi:hypothetical protein
MSEKIYTWLLRLYPSHFREQYGEDAMQLFRDRTRDERGFPAKFRLWAELLVDCAVSIPREYRRVQPTFVGATAEQNLFRFLGGEAPDARAVFVGALLSLIPVFLLSIPAGHYPPLHASFASLRRPVLAWPALIRSSEVSAHRSNRPRAFRITPVAMFDVPQDAAPATKLDATERRRVVEGAAAELRQHYATPEVGQKIADALLAHEKAGDYDAVTDGQTFADLLTKQIQEVGHDLHLDVAYVRGGIPGGSGGPSPASTARYRQALEQENCTFEKIQILAHNIGYLKLNTFPDVAYCEPTATAAMAKLNGSDAIIFDLRDNRGGYGNMVSLIAAYLFDHPEYLYSPRDLPTEQSWTRSPVPGNRLADKPAYVLISGTTASAAEHFTYNVKMLKRATLVGETTRGATHSGMFYRIDEHFGIGVQEVKPVNPYSKTDWAVVGIDPDVKVPAPQALERAVQMAEDNLRKR